MIARRFVTPGSPLLSGTSSVDCGGAVWRREETNELIGEIVSVANIRADLGLIGVRKNDDRVVILPNAQRRDYWQLFDRLAPVVWIRINEGDDVEA